MYTVVEDQAPYYMRCSHPGQEEIVRICQEYLAGLKPADHFTHHKVDPQTAQRIADLIPIGQHIPIMLERISLFITPPGVYYPAHKDGVDHRCSLNYAVNGSSRTGDRSFFGRRGKSELRRAGRWVTPRRGNPTESATETYRPSSEG